MLLGLFLCLRQRPVEPKWVRILIVEGALVANFINGLWCTRIESPICHVWEALTTVRYVNSPARKCASVIRRQRHSKSQINTHAKSQKFSTLHACCAPYALVSNCDTLGCFPNALLPLLPSSLVWQNVKSKIGTDNLRLPSRSSSFFSWDALHLSNSTDEAEDEFE